MAEIKTIDEQLQKSTPVSSEYQDLEKSKQEKLKEKKKNESAQKRLDKEEIFRQKAISDILDYYKETKKELKQEKSTLDQSRMTLVTNFINELKAYETSRNEKHKSADDFKRASVNFVSVFGIKKDPDYRKRRVYIDDLIKLLTQYGNIGDHASKDAVKNKILEGQQFKPSTDNNNSLESVLKRISKGLDLGIKPTYTKS